MWSGVFPKARIFRSCPLFFTVTAVCHGIALTLSRGQSAVSRHLCHWVIADCLGLMQPARAESCPAGQRRGPATPGEDKLPSPDQYFFHISTTPTTQGQKRRSPGSMPPRKVWKPQPNWLVADWLRLMEPARRESCLSEQRRGPATPGEDRVSSPELKSFHVSTTQTTWGRKRGSPGPILPRTVLKPKPHWPVADWLGLMEPACGESCPSGQRRGPVAPREETFPSPDHKSFHLSTTAITRGQKQRSSRSIPPRKVWKPQPNWLVADWMRLMEPARGESCPSRQSRGLTAPGEDNVLSPDVKSFHISTTPTIRGRKQRSPGSKPPRVV